MPKKYLAGKVYFTLGFVSFHVFLFLQLALAVLWRRQNGGEHVSGCERHRNYNKL